MPIIEAFWESDFFGKSILIILLILSIFAWSVILRKYLLFRKAKLASDNFYSIYRKHSKNPLQLAEKKLYFEESPFYQICDEALGNLSEIVKNKKHGSGNPGNVEAISDSDLEAIEKSLDRCISNETLKLEKNLNLLATAAAVSPFLGLLGTVWGVLIAFQRMAREQSAQIGVVTQGISVALVTTVVGLLVAIPSLVMYNYMANLIKRFETEMESFASEILSDIGRRYML